MRRANRADRLLPSRSLGEIRHVKIDRERDEADQAQRPSNPAAPQFDLIGRSIRLDRIASGKMIGRSLRRAGQCRCGERVALAQRLERGERLAALVFIALMRTIHGAKHRPVRRRIPFRQDVDAAALMRERSGMTWGMCMRWVLLAAMFGAVGFAAPEAVAAPSSKVATAATEISAQERWPPTRFRVYPGRQLLY